MEQEPESDCGRQKHRAMDACLLMQEQGNAAAMGAGASSDDGQQPTTQDAPSTSHGPERDAEAEQELTDAARSDPFAAYDVEVTLEGQAIREYLGMLGDLDAAV